MNQLQLKKYKTISIKEIKNNYTQGNWQWGRKKNIDISNFSDFHNDDILVTNEHSEFDKSSVKSDVKWRFPS